MHVMRPFKPNFDRKVTHTKTGTPNAALFLNGLCRCTNKTLMHGMACDIPW